MVFLKLVWIVILAVAVLPFSGCNKGQTPKDERKPIDTSLSRKLTVVSPAFLSPEMEQLRQSSHESTVEIAKEGAGVAFVEPVKGKFRVVHNGKAGKPYVAISELSISNDGKRVAYVANIDNKFYLTVVDGEEGFAFGADDNHSFSPDGKHHISTVTKDDKKYIVADKSIFYDYEILKMPLISPDSASLAFSAKSSDGSRKQFIISDMKLQNKAVFDSCGEYIIPSNDSSRLAVVCSDNGKSSIKVLDFLKRTVISDSQLNGTITRLRFGADNRSLSYTVLRNEDQRYVVYNGKEEKIPAGDETLSDPLVLSEPEGVGVIVGNAFKAYLYRAFQKQDKRGKEYGYISDFVSSADGRHNTYVATKVNELQMQIVVDGNEGPKYDKIISPLFSPDGRFLAYRAKQAGKRFLVVSDLKGKIIRKHQDYDMVFQPVFTGDGTSVAYGVLDGNEFWWKVEKLE